MSDSDRLSSKAFIPKAGHRLFEVVVHTDPKEIAALGQAPWWDTLRVSAVVKEEIALTPPQAPAGFLLMEKGDAPEPILSSELIAAAESKAHANIAVTALGAVGLGVFALSDMEPGALVAEYTGEVVDINAVASGGAYMIPYPVEPASAGWTLLVDAERGGGFARYINHSFAPNCYATRADWGGLAHIVLVTKEKIERGAQLFISYGAEFWKERDFAPLELPRHLREIAAFVDRIGALQ